MTKIILFNKPFDVLTQFTDADGRETLKDYIDVTNVYPAGRLDRDSEGLVVLTDSGALQHQISDPKYKLEKTYWVQVENIPDETALMKLRNGVELRNSFTKPAKARLIKPPVISERIPPIRERKKIPTQWLELKISEGKNRQVRRVTAAVGHPTLRLIRYAVGEWTIKDLDSGQWKAVNAQTMIKFADDLDSKKRHRRDHRTRKLPSNDKRNNRQHDDIQSTRRSSRSTRKPD